MDFRPDPTAEAMRAEARALFDRHLTDDVRERMDASGTVFDGDFHRALARGGWLTAGWPVEDGGQGRNAVELAPFYEEAALAGAPLDLTLTTMLVAETLRRAGTPEQRATVLRGIVDGAVNVCLGLSEPDAGSDVAAARTRAVRDGDGWVIDGQKVFTTGAQIADYVFLLTRTDPEVPKHRGLTIFLVPMDTPGVEIQPVHTLGGERTNITYYTAVWVPDSARVGDVDGGWSVLLITLAFERGMAPTAAGRARRLLDLTVRWAAGAVDDDGRSVLDDPAVRLRLARAAIAAEVGRLLGLQAVSAHAKGTLPVVEGSMAKLFASEALQDIVGSLLELVGPAAVLASGAAGSPMAGALEAAYRHAAVETIYSGTSEIQRDIIATQGLGLPRHP
jgi:alkylation response protein AidB-like acyl-CoA dehydrogenase